MYGPLISGLRLVFISAGPSCIIQAFPQINISHIADIHYWHLVYELEYCISKLKVKHMSGLLAAFLTLQSYTVSKVYPCLVLSVPGIGSGSITTVALMINDDW